MDWLFEFLKDAYIGFNDEDIDFIKAFQEAIFKSFVNYFQADLEKSLDNTLFYTLDKTVRYNRTVELTYQTDTYSNITLPYRLPAGTKTVTAFGPTVSKTETVELPHDFGEYATIQTVSGTNYSIDGGKVLGSGSATVTYLTSLVEATIEDGYVTGPSSINKLSIEHTPYDALKYVGQGAVTTSGYLYDPNSWFDKLPVNTIFVIGGAMFYLKDTQDPHTAIMDIPIYGPGRAVNYYHEGFQYVGECEYSDIPAFDNGLISKADYYIKDGKIGFASIPDDVLIAPVAYKDNPSIYEKFGAYIELPSTASPDKVRALWSALFGGSISEIMSFALSLEAGLAVTLPSTGKLTVKKNIVDITTAKNWINLTVGRNHVISSSLDYFLPEDKYIQFEDNSFARIIHYLSPTSVVIDSKPLEYNSTLVGRVVVANIPSSTIVINDQNEEIEISLKGLPFYGVNEEIPIWRRICSGITIVDKQILKNNYVLPNTLKYQNGTGDDFVRQDVISPKVFTVFTDFAVDTDIIDKTKPSETDYVINKSYDTISLYERIEIV